MKKIYNIILIYFLFILITYISCKSTNYPFKVEKKIVGISLNKYDFKIYKYLRKHKLSSYYWGENNYGIDFKLLKDSFQCELLFKEKFYEFRIKDTTMFLLPRYLITNNKKNKFVLHAYTPNELRDRKFTIYYDKSKYHIFNEYHEYRFLDDTLIFNEANKSMYRIPELIVKIDNINHNFDKRDTIYYNEQCFNNFSSNSNLPKLSISSNPMDVNFNIVNGKWIHECEGSVYVQGENINKLVKRAGYNYTFINNKEFFIALKCLYYYSIFYDSVEYKLLGKKDIIPLYNNDIETKKEIKIIVKNGIFYNLYTICNFSNKTIKPKTEIETLKIDSCCDCVNQLYALLYEYKKLKKKELKINILRKIKFLNENKIDCIYYENKDRLNILYDKMDSIEKMCKIFNEEDFEKCKLYKEAVKLNDGDDLF